MKTVDIPGGTATFRGPEELRGRDSDRIKAKAMSMADVMAKFPDALNADVPGETPEEKDARQEKMMEGIQFSAEELTRLLEMKRTTVVSTLASWTLPDPMPTTEDELADLPRGLYDALIDAVGGDLQSLVAGTELGATAKDLKPRPDLDSPFGNSKRSEAPSKGGRGSSSTPESQSDGESTLIESSTGA